jgi:hypothetical protein
MSIHESHRDRKTRAPEYLSKAGAEQLAERLRQYWAKHDRVVDVWVEKTLLEDVGDKKTRHVYAVRSDLHFGASPDAFSLSQLRGAL